MDSPGLITWAQGAKQYEGWAEPGDELNGTRYPSGSPSFRNNNPGNLRYSEYTHSLGATHTSMSGFAVFPTYEAGFEALKQFLRDARANHLIAYRRYAGAQEHIAKVAAEEAGTPYTAIRKYKNGGYLCTLGDFYRVYAPTTDNNAPDKYSAWMARWIACPESISIDDI